MNIGMSRLTRILIILVAIIGSVVIIYLKNPPILGLDLRGGVMLLLQADFSRENFTQSERESAVQSILETIRFRVNATGLAETSVTQVGVDRISVEIPCSDPDTCDNPEDLRNLVERRGFLEFKKVLRQVNPQTETIASTEQLVYSTDGTAYVVDPRPLLTGAAIEHAESTFGGNAAPLQAAGGFEIALTFTDDGAETFANLMRGTNPVLPAGSVLGIILDSQLQSAPAISPDIVSIANNQGPQGLKRGTSITGDFSQDESIDLAIVLRSGNLPVPVTVEQEETVGPSIGQDSINKGVFATMLAGILVLIFMIAYYKLAGIIANFTIALNLLMLIAAMMLLDATWTLPGIAGLILTIGMGVDSNVLIFERVREELRSGKTVRAAIDFGYERALLTIIDAHVTTLITALILFTFGTGAIKGFATTLSIGIFINLFTALIGTRLAFDIIKSKNPRRMSI